MTRQKKVERFKNLVDIVYTFLLYVIATVLLLGVICGTVLNHGIEHREGFSFFNYAPMVVVSGSMLPTIEINSFIIGEYCDIEDIETNDIIIYRYNGLNISHRAVRKVYDENNEFVGYIAKGDNNLREDPELVTSNNFIGKIVFICNPASKLLDFVVNSDYSVNRLRLLEVSIGIFIVIYIIERIIRWLFNIACNLYISLDKN